MSNVTVQFIQRWNAYNCGEFAGFPQADAQSLINRGFAVVKPMPALIQKEPEGNKSSMQDPSPEGHQEVPIPGENQESETKEDSPVPEKGDEPDKPSESDKKNKKK